MQRHRQVPGVILAGGQGRRMGGGKAFANLGGRPLLTHVRDRLAPQCAELVINANDDQERYRALGLPVLPDGEMQGMGPLAGVLAALDWGATMGVDRVLTAPVDTPFVPLDLVDRLAAADAPIALAQTADGFHGTCGLWSVGLRSALRSALRAGARKVTDWTASQGAVGVRFPETSPPPFFNINRPEDLEQAEAFLHMPTHAAFDVIVMVDWSARSTPSPRKPTKDAIFIATRTDKAEAVTYCRTRAEAFDHLLRIFDDALARGQRVLAGFDFPFGYPRGFTTAATGSADPLAFWAWLDAHIEDDPRNGNNRLEVADGINAAMPGAGPFWSHPTSAQPQFVPFRKPPYDGFPFAERRKIEMRLPGASSCFQLYGAGAVASQSLLGLPYLHRLRTRYGDAVAVRPFETADATIVLAEIYPSLLAPEVRALRHPDEILDAAQVRVMARAFAGVPAGDLAAMLCEGDQEEGWIVGVGHEAALAAAARSFDIS